MRRNVLFAAYGVPAGLAVIAAFWFLIASPAVEAAHVSTGYVAKSVCSCVFIAARDLSACRADLGAEYEPMNVVLDREQHLVRAHAGLISGDTARFSSRYGCRLD